MTPRISVGDRIPQATLAHLDGDDVRHVLLADLVGSRRVMLAGVPGAFTPICSCRHVPDLLDNRAALQAAGIAEIFVVAPNSPWAVKAWANEVDPLGRLSFLSDGNLSLARALGVTVTAHEMMLGETSTRYMMVIDRGIVQRFNVETQLMRLDCTRARDAVFID